MICDKYSSLNMSEKILFVGELTHACMSDNDLYEMGQALIELARQKGLLDNVVIMPSSIDLPKEENN